MCSAVCHLFSMKARGETGHSLDYGESSREEGPVIEADGPGFGNAPQEYEGAASAKRSNG